jgi:hypothetical protein
VAECATLVELKEVFRGCHEDRVTYHGRQRNGYGIGVIFAAMRSSAF